MYGYIYLTTNLINNKKYIGQHRAEKLDKNYLGSGVLLQKAILHYGRENFETILLRDCFSEEELNDAEIELIKRYDAVNSDQYYNIANGGEGHTCAPWNKGLSGLPFTERQLKNLEKGWHQAASEKQKQQLAERRKNCIVSDKTRKLLSERAKDKIGITKENQNKMIYPEELQYYLEDGWQIGHTYKDIDSRVNKFKETIRNKTDLEKQQTREKLRNAFLGKIWVTNGTISKQIDPKNLDEFLANGFIRGRKFK